MTDSSSSINIPVTLKWGKQTFSLSINSGENSCRFKERVQKETGVPIARQKLLAKKKGLWKGPLKDDVTLQLLLASPEGGGGEGGQQQKQPLVVTLIGSAETLEGPPTGAKKTKFIEDLTPEDLRRQEEEQFQQAIKTATGMIQTLQLPPHHRDDYKQEMYQYNRFVSGLPQRQIEQELLKLQKQNAEAVQLQGKVAMNMGMELRRAYINDIAVLADGTCVSVLDDGHVQLWKHAAQQEDVVHGAGEEGPVNSVVALRGSGGSGCSSAPSFATAGRGIVQIWNEDAEPIVALRGAMPGTTPASLTTSILDTGGGNNNICLASRFQITRQNNPQQFRLPPQDANERQRRAQAEAQEHTIQQALDKASKCIQVWFSTSSSIGVSGGGGGGTNLQTQILEPPEVATSAATITCLSSMSLQDGTKLLIAGDAAGGLRVWKVVQSNDDGNNSSNNSDSPLLQFVHQGLYQFQGSTIVCLEPLQNQRLAVSTDHHNNPDAAVLLPNATSIISTEYQRAVHILDFSSSSDDSTTGNPTPPPIKRTSLVGHAEKDAVICMKELPTGDLLTGGGKLDATLQLWSKSQLDGSDPKEKDNKMETDDNGAAAGAEATTTSEVGTMEEEEERHNAAAAVQVVDVRSKSKKTFTGDVGYVFSIEVLPDAKSDSDYFAVAVARYNTVKIII